MKINKGLLVNKRLSKSARKMKDLGLYKHERKEILRGAYSPIARLFTTKREKLEWELGNFTQGNQGETFYRERSGNPYFDSHFDSKEVAQNFTKGVIYDAVFG